MSKPIKAWHFLNDDGSFCYDKNKRKPKLGGTERVKPTKKRPLEIYEFGLHASMNILDALICAQGALLRRVELGGEILKENDKLCASERRELWRMDVTNILHEFACWCAERALKCERKVGHEPDKRSWAAIEKKRYWLKGEISDEDLNAAADAARAAAWDATNAAWAANRAANRAAIRARAWYIARAATRDAPWVAPDAANATKVANRDAAKYATNTFRARVWRAAAGAARPAADAARDAACYAARDAANAARTAASAASHTEYRAQRRKLLKMVETAHSQEQGGGNCENCSAE